MRLSGESAALAYAVASHSDITEDEATRRALLLYLWLMKQSGTGLALGPHDIATLLEGRKPW